MAVVTRNPLVDLFLIYSPRVLRLLETAIIAAKDEHKEKIAVISIPASGVIKGTEWLKADQSMQPFSYFYDPARNLEVMGAGSAKEWLFTGDQTILQVKQSFQDSLVDLAGDLTISPLFYGGFAFAPGEIRKGLWASWPDGLWILPKWQWIKEGGQAFLLSCQTVNPASSPEKLFRYMEKELKALSVGESLDERNQVHSFEVTVEDGDEYSKWETMVEDSVADIRSGKFEKIVLARKISLQSDRIFDTQKALEVLKDHNPTSVTFYINYKDLVFLGATPERLVEVDRENVSIDCLAGTALRGKSEEEDRLLGELLLKSDKDQKEHMLVRKGIFESISDLAHLHATEKANLKKLTNVQHLYTPIKGELKPGKSLFDLVEKLHPTPAVAGLPKDLAKGEILKREGMDRGYYAGPIGWVDRTGNGTFVVALRSGVISGTLAELYAGAGIVENSIAKAEWNETDWKFQPMRTALGVLKD